MIYKIIKVLSYLFISNDIDYIITYTVQMAIETNAMQNIGKEYPKNFGNYNEFLENPSLAQAKFTLALVKTVAKSKYIAKRPT